MSTRSHPSSPERRLALAALLLASLVLVGAPAGAQPAVVPAGEAGARARAALADPRFQRALPSHSESDEPFKKSPGGNFPVSSGEDDSRNVLFPTLGAGAFLGKLIFTVLLVVIGVLIVTWIGREILRRRRRDARKDPVADPIAAASALEREPAFDDASRLAAEGRYAEAVHALLLAAIRHFAERSRTPVQPSRTSRELVRLLPLGPEAREAFAELVRTVELSLFGGADVEAADYERNLARFQALTRRAA
jgi:hypothetical protein